MDFWQQVFSPGGLAGAVVCTLLGCILGLILTRVAKRGDDREDLIEDVAEKYRHLREINKTDGADGLMMAGVCRLADSQEIEKAITIIKSFGNRDPLGPLREQLAGKDLHHFFIVLRDERLNPLQLVDLQKALSKTRSNQR